FFDYNQKFTPSGGSNTPTNTSTPGGPTFTPTRTSTPGACNPTWAPVATYTPGVYALQGGVAADGNLYVAGGMLVNNTPTAHTGKFNTSTNTWTDITRLPVTVGQGSESASGTKFYVAGGFLGGTSI